MNLSRAPYWLVTSGRVLELHEVAVQQWGGAAGAPNVSCVEGAIGDALTAALYIVDLDEDPDVLTTASYLLFYLARSHCFTDGNKRVAWMAFAEQLAVLGLHVEASQTEVVDFVNRVATGGFPVAEIIEWVAPRLTALPGYPAA